MNKRRRLIIFTATLGTLLCLMFTYVIAQALFPFKDRPERREWEAKWIEAPGVAVYSGAFRRDYVFNAEVVSAWARVAARDSFEVIVNGNTASRSFLWRPTRPFQNGLSEYGQRLNWTPPLLALNYPREYQWSGHTEYKTATYLDLSNHLRKGHNSLCVTVESRSEGASVVLEGEVLLSTGKVVRFGTDENWAAYQTPPNFAPLHWSSPNVVLDQPDFAELSQNAPRVYFDRFNPMIFQKRFRPKLIRSENQPKDAAVWFEKDWVIDGDTEEAWIRILSVRPFDIFINGQRVNAVTYGGQDLGMGEWILGSQQAMDPAARPSLLDPDEVGHLYVGKEFMNPRHSDPTVNDFKQFENTLNRTNTRPNAVREGILPGELEDEKERINPNPASFENYVPSSRTPEALTRNRQTARFYGYTVTRLLKKGSNKVLVKLYPEDHALPMSWAPDLAIDGRAESSSGHISWLETDESWSSRVQLPGSSTSFDDMQASTIRGRLVGSMKKPSLQYRGYVYNQSQKLSSWTGGLVGSIGFLGLFLLVALRRRRLSNANLARISQGFAIPCSILLGAIFLRISWAERSEYLWLHSASFWWGVIVLSFVSLVFGFKRFFVGRAKNGLRFYERFFLWVETVPHSRIWPFLIVWLLMFSFFVRAYNLDFQTIDDDEYASIQASMAIAEKGVPQYSEEVWYTRSPLYHYLTGFVIWVFGPNLWSFRLPSVLFGVASTWLCYLCCVRLLGSRWLGLAAMLLYALHPFLVFSSHIARFYQQQQFFALLTAYFFCRGFVTGQAMMYRYATLGAFLAAIISQELSVVIGFQLLLGYLLFAKRKRWAEEIRFIVIAGCVVGLTVVDIAIFQTRTLTRLEGVSPNVEATLSPNFSSPMNYLSVFFAYSRLHLSLSVLFFLGLPLAFKNANRNVLAMYYMLFSGVLFTNLLVTADSLRYQYWLIPLWIMLGLHSVGQLMAYLDQFLRTDKSIRSDWIRPAVTVVLFVAILVSWSPWRMVGSYDSKLLGDATGAFQYIRTHMRPGDKVGATEPHPHGILLETGRADYDIAFPLLYDFVYLKEGEMIDRNASAKVVSSVEQLQTVFAENERVWIAINREKFRSRGKNLRWEYPGARAELLLRKQCEVAYQSYLWTVFLWDSNKGNYLPFRQNWAR